MFWVDHVTIYRWVQTIHRCSRTRPARADTRSATAGTDETYVKVAGKWRSVYRAVDQYGQIIDVLVSARRDLRGARRFFGAALRAHGEPVEVVTDQAPALRATNSVSTRVNIGASRPRSPNSPKRSEPGTGRQLDPARPIRLNATAPLTLVSGVPGRENPEGLADNPKQRLTAEETWEFCLHGLGV